MGFNVYLSAGKMIVNIEFDSLVDSKSLTLHATLCIITCRQQTSLIYIVKNMREKHTSEAYLASNQVSDMELFKK